MSSKREEIREGIAGITEDRFRVPAEKAGLIWDRNFNYMLASNILSYLHSQGCVLKVEGELPKGMCLYIEDGKAIKQYVSGIPDEEQPQEVYVAVEPLIEQ